MLTETYSSSFRTCAKLSLLNKLFLVGVFAIFAGCVTMPPDQQYEISAYEQEMKEIHLQLEALAQDVGVEPEQASRETTLGLISEIRMASRNYKSYRGKTLSTEEKGIISSYLNDQPDILNTILEQDRFVRSLNKKRIIFLPDKD